MQKTGRLTMILPTLLAQGHLGEGAEYRWWTNFGFLYVPYSTGTLIGIPFGYLVAFGIFLSSTPWLARKSLRRMRASHGMCVQCGYDLRANPASCPECGAKIVHETES